MSQKKLKKIRKEENIILKKSIVEDKVLGVREILKNNWKFLLLLCLGVIALYFNAMSGDFVSDDYATVTQNPDITNFKATFSPSFFVNLVKTVVAKTFGINSPIPFHIVSLILYLLIIIVAFVFLNLFFNNLTSVISIVVFSVLPVHVEAVSWISGAPYLLTSLLVLMELICFVLFFKTKNKKYLIFLFTFLVVSFFTDRIRGFSFVLLAGLIVASFPEKFKFKINLMAIVTAVLVGAGLLFLIGWPMIKNRIEAVNSGVNASESVFYNPFFQYPTAIPKYLQLIVFPSDITLYHTMYIIPVWLNWLITITYLTSLVWFWFKNKKIFFALAFIFVASAPSMAPVKVSWLVAERYVFLGSLGMALLMAIYIEKWWQKKTKLTVFGLTILCLLYSARVFLRNIDWQTNHNLWVNTCQVSPNSHNAWNNIGDDYDKLANTETTEEGKMNHYYNSIKGFQQSYVVKPNYADAYHNQANIFYKIGRLDLARATYEKALSFNPNLYQTYMTLLQIDLAQKNEPELMRHLSIIQQMKPNDLQVAYISAVAYREIGRINEAKQLADMMYKQFPNVAEIKSLYDSLNSTGTTIPQTIN